MTAEEGWTERMFKVGGRERRRREERHGETEGDEVLLRETGGMTFER